jgi:uridine kinase
MDDLRITFSNCPAASGDPLSCPPGTPADTLIGRSGVHEREIAAIRVNNEILPLNARLEVNAALEPVLLESPEGVMIYRRSLAFMLAIAARNLFPDRNLSIGHSLGNSYYYTFTTGKKPAEDEIGNLKKAMEQLVHENLPITFRYAAYADALEIFKKNNQTATSLLLDYRCESRIKINECKGYADIYVEPLVRRTGLLSVFDLEAYEEGFLLRFPAVGRGGIIDPFEDSPRIFSVYKEYKKWGRIVGVRSVGELNARISNRTIKDYIRIAEAFQGR